MTAVYADPHEHAAWLLHNICDPLRTLVRTDKRRAFLNVKLLSRRDLETVALLLAGASHPTVDLSYQLRWTEPPRYEHRDEWPEAPRPLVVHRA